jgi:hypothetical protein
LKHCPFNLALSQAKYFYNYFSFFVIQILVCRFSLEALNFQFTTKTPMFFSHCWAFVIFFQSARRWEIHTY